MRSAPNNGNTLLGTLTQDKVWSRDGSYGYVDIHRMDAHAAQQATVWLDRNAGAIADVFRHAGHVVAPGLRDELTFVRGTPCYVRLLDQAYPRGAV